MIRIERKSSNQDHVRIPSVEAISTGGLGTAQASQGSMSRV